MNSVIQLVVEMNDGKTYKYKNVEWSCGNFESDNPSVEFLYISDGQDDFYHNLSMVKTFKAMNEHLEDWSDF
jgi:hypothetical protein